MNPYYLCVKTDERSIVFGDTVKTGDKRLQSAA